MHTYLNYVEISVVKCKYTYEKSLSFYKYKNVISLDVMLKKKTAPAAAATSTPQHVPRNCTLSRYLIYNHLNM